MGSSKGDVALAQAESHRLETASGESPAQEIARLLQTLQLPTSYYGVEPDIFEKLQPVHDFPPSISRQTWNRLGAVIKVYESPVVSSIPGDCWISLRCDGTGFSRWTKQMRSKGILEDGYSQDFASIMRTCCRALMEKFGGKAAFTHSDEMSILIPPASVVRAEQQPHMYNGRVAKLTSLAAATVTARFNFELQQLCDRPGLEKMTVDDLATFDCRVGMYQTKEEAVSLLLWRAYDCSINAVQDAVYRCKGKVKGVSQAMQLPIGPKLQWLVQHAPAGTLPLPRHQRHGSYFVNRKVKIAAVDQRTGEAVERLRSRTELVEGNLLLIFRQDKMFRDDDTLTPEKISAPTPGLE